MIVEQTRVTPEKMFPREITFICSRGIKEELDFDKEEFLNNQKKDPKKIIDMKGADGEKFNSRMIR